MNGLNSAKKHTVRFISAVETYLEVRRELCIRVVPGGGVVVPLLVEVVVVLLGVGVGMRDGSKEYVVGLSVEAEVAGKRAGEEPGVDERELERARGETPGFCFERFICKHNSGLSR